jgi:hypothetical protein
MAVLKALEVKVLSSTKIQAKFNLELDPLINTSNISIRSNVFNIPDPAVLEVKVSKDKLTILTQPLFPYTQYFVTFKSSDLLLFKSINGVSLVEDGKLNVFLILGAEDPSNPFRDYFLYELKDDPYNLDYGTIVRDIINVNSDFLANALYDIRELKNDNYLSRTIFNELKTRGAGPVDRLSEGGAYEIIKVSKNAEGRLINDSINFEEFPSYPITLQRKVVSSEKLTPGSGTSTVNGLLLNLKNKPITAVKSIIIQYSNSGKYIYNISSLGYQIQDNRYDPDYASSYQLLEENQVLLSSLVLEDDNFFTPVAGDIVYVSYEYKDLGRIVSEDSIEVYKILEINREVVPPILNSFSLPHYPIVDEVGNIPTFNGIEFLDPLSNPPFSQTHPAFIKEIPYKLEGLPKAVGEYSVDYSTGSIYVYGAEKNDGTGDFPPVVSYLYKNLFVKELDYNYDEDTYEVVRSPLRFLEGDSAKISFSYEKTLIPYIDFIPKVHTEVLNERIENKFLSNNSFIVNNAPVTNVFRIYNETSGEVYSVDRFSFNKVYFSSRISPQVNTIIKERAEFSKVENELLLVNEELTNLSSVKIFKINLQNNKIISSTEDSIGSSFNSSVFFSRTDIFSTELYYDYVSLTEGSNINKLSVGQYLINYQDGIVYVGVDNNQVYDVGTISYKKPYIKTQFSHIIAVNNLYNSILPNKIYKNIKYNSFSDSEILPSTFEVSDERFLNQSTLNPYIVSSNTITVTDDISYVRGVYDLYDLNNNIDVVNFSENYSSSSNVITLTPIQRIVSSQISAGLIVSLPYVSPGVEIYEVKSIIRKSDNVELYDTGAIISGYDIILSGVNSPVTGEEVTVYYSIRMNGSATPVVDYARGDLFLDYEYVADEVLVSYEHGDNCLDFSQSNSIDEGEEYYVTYKVGALRNALFKNFGSLVNIPILNSFDTSLERERYRDALRGALQSFAKGPTLPSMKSLVEFITHIPPEIVEAAFDNWNLNIGHLYNNQIETTGNLLLSPGKFDNGVLIENADETISFPVSNNLKLEEGTLEMWVVPKWNGLDNDATLTFQVLKDGYVLPSDHIFIGAAGNHPTLDLNNKFSVIKNDNSIGLPTAIYTNIGAFIFYDEDQFRWKFLVRDKISDGYSYHGTIETSGSFYHVNFIDGLGELTDKLKTKNSIIEFTFNIDSQDELYPDGYVDGYADGYVDGYDGYSDGYYPLDGYVPGYSFDGIRFMSDNEHYLFDFGNESYKNRFSLFKDGSGYLTFRVYDNGSFDRINKYTVSADISNWRAGESHHVAISWKLATKDKKDEMHLFIDGIEIPNIIKYGGRPISTLTDRFRTVVPEYVLGTITQKIITFNDLNTDGSNLVYSDSINFTSEGIVPGDILEIKELGLGAYTISSVSGNYLTLTSAVPSVLSNARFTINPYSIIVSSEIDLYKNFTVSLFSGSSEEELPGLRADIPGYEISKNFLNQNILTILGNANVGDQVVIRTLGLNFRRARERVYVWGNNLNILRTQLPSPINLDEVKIYPVILPKVAIGPSNSTYSLGLFNFTTSDISQTSSPLEGRTLAIKVFSGNVDFSTPVTVVINGTTNSTPNETLTFSSAGTQYTTKKFTNITSVDVIAKPFNPLKNSAIVEIKEKYTITYSEGNSVFPVIRYSYKTQTGSTLSGNSGSSIVEDLNGYFVFSNIDQSLVISSPISVAGTYQIVNKLSDKSIEVFPALPASFSNGIYDIFNTSISRSGFANGFFTLETAGQVNVPFNLNNGYYDFDYSVNLEIPFDPLTNDKMYIGSSIHGDCQASSIIDELRILSTMLTDVRIGETLISGTESVTIDAAKIRPFRKNSDTLTLIHFDDKPFNNDSDFWISSNKEYIQSTSSVNSDFGKSLLIKDRPLIYDNLGYLSTSSQGTIEFWVSPMFDTGNDPEYRFYFDAAALTTEDLISTSKASIILNNRASSISSIYVEGDKKNYAAQAVIQSDFKTVKLSIPLPYQKTPVKVTYTQVGVLGDRISIYKDSESYINLTVKASGKEYQVRQPVLWTKNSWHRIKATFKFNQPNNNDEIGLFVDGEERGTVRFGNGLLFGTGAVYGQGFAGVDNSTLTADINFLDVISKFYIGSDINSVNLAKARIDNFKISNIVQPFYMIAGQSKDVNYNSNIDTVFPVVEDAYTTFLLNFNALFSINTEWATLRDKYFGIYNFTIKIIDSFDIVSESEKVKQILETLINILKPAQSKVTLEYLD